MESNDATEMQMIGLAYQRESFHFPAIIYNNYVLNENGDKKGSKNNSATLCASIGNGIWLGVMGVIGNGHDISECWVSIQSDNGYHLQFGRFPFRMGDEKAD